MILLVRRRSLRRSLQVGAMLAALSCAAVLSAAPASADSETFLDGKWDYGVDRPESDIASVTVSLDASTVSVAIRVVEWDVAVLHNRFMDVVLYGNAGTPSRAIYKRGDTENGFMSVLGNVFDADPACPVTTVYDGATSSVRFSAPAACVGSPSTVRASAWIASGGQGVGDNFPGFGQTSRAVGSGPETGPTSPLIGVYRFWDGRRHQYSRTPSEALWLSLRTRWESDVFGVRGFVGDDGEGVPACETGLVPVYEFWSLKTDAFFYTSNAAEADHIERNDPDWVADGPAYCAFATQEPGTVPLYRFYSPVFQSHFYTADEQEAHIVRTTDRNWTYEGVSHYVLPRLAY